MAFKSKRKKGCENSRSRAVIREMKDKHHCESGLTLIELLATLLITTIIASVVIYTISFEVTSWNRLVPVSHARTNTTFVMGKLQPLFQNLKSVALDPALSTKKDGETISAGLIGTDVDGNTVKIQVKPKTYSDGTESEAIVVQIIPPQDNSSSGSGSTGTGDSNGDTGGNSAGNGNNGNTSDTNGTGDEDGGSWEDFSFWDLLKSIFSWDSQDSIWNWLFGHHGGDPGGNTSSGNSTGGSTGGGGTGSNSTGGNSTGDNGGSSTGTASGEKDIVYSFNDTSFQGTTFSIHNFQSTGSTTDNSGVDMSIQATYRDGSTSGMYHVTQTFIAGGVGEFETQ